jgi:ferric enterobactin receptor
MKTLRLKLLAVMLMRIAITDNLYAQSKGKISGSTKDAKTHEAVSFVTVTLSSQGTSKAIIQQTQTDSLGNFILDNLPPDKFILKLSFVGYDPVVKENLVIDAAKGDLSLGDILMNASANKVLNEVNVTAIKPTIQSKDGKKIFTADQSLVSQGGTAADLLQNVPTLQIDANGNVSLRGLTGVKLLIDGKPSIIAGGDISQILQSIPASAIDRVEVITNPSAKYDADGEGIINIILKKNSKPGLNGTVTLEGGTRDNYNGSGNLNYQTGKVNIYGNYSLRNGDTYSNGFQYITFLQPTDATVFSNELFPSTTRNKIQNLKTGIDYSISPNSVLSISGNMNLRNIHRNEFLDIDYFDANDALLQSETQNNTINKEGKNYESDLDYLQHFKKPKEELTFNFAYGHGNFNNMQVYQTQSISGPAAQPVASPLESDIFSNAVNYNIQADYVSPIGKTGQLSAGYRTQVNLVGNNQFAYNLNPQGVSPFYAFTDFFNSNSQVDAVYLNYQNQFKNFNYELGVRGEDAHTHAAYLGYKASNTLYETPINVPSKGLYPSIFLTQKLRDNQQLQFSYSGRTSRPTVQELDPSTDFSDPTNYSTGNPQLLPETINSLQLGYNKTWQNISFTSSIYYNGISSVIKHIQTDPVNDVISTIPENFRFSSTTGLELIGHFTLVKDWDFTANANVFERLNDAAPQYGIAANNGLSWNANITNNISVIKGLSLQIHADYRAADMVLQDVNRPAFGLDAGAKYDFPGNRAFLSFVSTDIFNSRDWAFLRSSDDLLLNFERRYVASRATLSFTWRFGNGSGAPKTPKKKEDKPDKRIDDAS